MNYNIYGNPMLFYIGAICGIVFWLIAVNLFRPHRLITYVGRNTIIILGLTGISNFVLRGLYYLATNKLPVANKLDLLETILYSLLLIACLIPVMHTINRFCPFMIGRVYNQAHFCKSAQAAVVNSSVL
jgi:fucose 4-O-acetylase-like acetyltransferase